MAAIKWYNFDVAKGFRQKRPPLYRQVLCEIAERENGMGMMPVTLAVGYRKNAAGDKSCPYFVVPGVGGPVVRWADCLPEEIAARFTNERTKRE